MATPWNRFRVGTPSERSNWTNPDCQPLTTLSHVAHVPTAYRIIQDQTLRADLVFDQSLLNTHRARVVWLSPNDWTGAGGFRYGNVSFEFPWAALIADRRYFWVESIAYGIEACRILITANDWSDTLIPYDPTRGDGPWWTDGQGNHYWNGQFCLEVMFEDDLPLETATGLSFVGHHPHFCNIDPATCGYRGFRADAAGAEFLATLLNRNANPTLPSVLHTYSNGRTGLDGRVGGSLHAIMRACQRLGVAGPGVTAQQPQAPAIGRALLGALHRLPNDERDQLASLFSCSKCLLEAVANVIIAGFEGSEADAVRRELEEWLE